MKFKGKGAMYLVMLGIFLFFGMHYAYGSNPDGTQKWSFQTGNYIESSPAIGSDGTIYVGSDDGKLYAIYDNGTQKWRFKTGGEISLSSPAIASDGTIYVGSYDDYLYAINPDGTQKWRFQTNYPIISSPAIGSDGTIYVGSYGGNLYAINDNGTLKWKYAIGEFIESSPAIGSDGTIYVSSLNHYLYAIYDNGTQKWRFQTNNPIISSPAIGSDGTIYVGSDDHYLYAIYDNGTQKWRFQTNSSILSSPAIGSDGTIYVGSYDHYLYAINPDGTQKWKFQTGYYIESSPAIGSDRTIYVGSYDHYLYAIYDNGTQKWRFQTNNPIVPSPAIGSDGTIYVGSSDKYLYAIYSDSHGPANSPWPMFHHDLMHIGRSGVKVIGYPSNRLIEISADNATIDNASASSMAQPSNAPSGVVVKNKIELHLTLSSGSNSTRLATFGSNSTRITISDIPTLSNMVFYKYVNGSFIDLTDNQACGNCNFTRTDNSTTHTTTISFTLTDGGPLDADSVSGTITDPVVVGTTSSGSSGGSSGSSGSSGSYTNESPIIDSFTATPTQGTAPLKVTFVCKAHDPDGFVTDYHWDFDGDGTYDNATSIDNITHTYTKAGIYTAKCLVADNAAGISLVHKVSVVVERPMVEHTLNLSPMPLNGSIGYLSGSEHLNCGMQGNDCSKDFDNGTSVTLTATPDSGYHFTGWSGNCSSCGSSTTCTITIDSDKTCSANFKENVNRPPVISSLEKKVSPSSPYTYTFTCSASDPDGEITKYKWDFNQDGVYDAETTESKAEYSYSKYGIYTVRVEAVDNDNGTATKTITVKVKPKNGDYANINYPNNKTIALITDNATVNAASASVMSQPSNTPEGIKVKNKIELSLTLAPNAGSTVVTISNIPTLSNMVFYKYVNGSFIDLTDNQACDNCNFTRTDNPSTGTTTISFTIEDGGVLDADGTINGKISDPVVVGTKQASPSPSPSPSPSQPSSSGGGGGGCTVSNSSSVGLLFILFAMLGFAIKRKFIG